MALRETAVLPLPNISTLTECWLSKVLTLYYDTDISKLSFKVEPSLKREGFLSDVSFVTTKYKINNEERDEHLVIKCMPSTTAQRKFVEDGKLSEREVEFYKFTQLETFRHVAEKSKMKLIIPEVLYCDFKDSNLTIVMKNLKVLKYKTIVDREGSDLQQQLKMCTSIAVIHAAGLYNLKKFGNVGIKKYDDVSFFDQQLIPNLQMLCELFKNSSLSSILQKLAPHYKGIRNALLLHPLFETVIHGDLWAGQCMFSEDEKEVCILDWQLATVGNPVLDLMSMFFMSSSGSILENHLDDILHHYWKELTQNLDKLSIDCPVSFKEFVECVENHWVTGFNYFVTCLEDFLGGDCMSDNRLRGLVHFLHKRNVFTNFIERYEDKNK